MEMSTKLPGLQEAFYRDRRGSTHPGCAAAQLIDEAGFALHSLLRSAAAMPAGSLDTPFLAGPDGPARNPSPRTSFSASLFFPFLLRSEMKRKGSG